MRALAKLLLPVLSLAWVAGGLSPAAADDDAIAVDDVTVGAGDLVEPGSLVTVHYIARTGEGAVFDTTYLRGEPLDIRQGVGQVPPGWDQALLGMRVGGYRVVDVPPGLGFGAKGPAGVPANAALHLELRVMDVGPPRRPPAQPTPSKSAWSRTPSGARIARLIEGSGRPARTGDKVVLELTAWNAEGGVLDTSYSRPGPDTFQPGSGRNHPDLEAALLGARPGDELLVELTLSAGQPPVRILLQVQETRSGREPAAAPTPVDTYATTASGLKTADLVVGTGATAHAGDTVVVEYTGWLTDGRMFDSSLARDAAFSFHLGEREVIKGWDEGVVGMQVGGTRQLVVPSALGYGDKGSPPTIPPSATLVFEVTLLQVK